MDSFFFSVNFEGKNYTNKSGLEKEISLIWQPALFLQQTMIWLEKMKFENNHFNKNHELIGVGVFY